MPVDPLSATNQQLYKVYTNLAELSGVQVNALTKQTSIMDMVKSENQRLKEKKNTIDQAVENQKRIIYFNDNSRKVYSAWLYILLVVIIVLGVIYVIRLLHTYYSEIIPDMVFSITIVGVVSLGLIICFRYWSDIRARDNYNFDELNLEPPILGGKDDNNTYGGLGLGSLVGCIGAQCCTPPSGDKPGTKWDPSIGKCLYVESVNSSITSTSSPTSIPSNSTGVPYSSSPPVVNPSSTPISVDKSVGANEAFEVGYSPV